MKKVGVLFNDTPHLIAVDSVSTIAFVFYELFNNNFSQRHGLLLFYFENECIIIS